MPENLIAAFAVCALATVVVLSWRNVPAANLSLFAIALTAMMGAFYPTLASIVAPRSWRPIYPMTDGAILGAQLDYFAFTVGLVLGCRSGMRRSIPEAGLFETGSGAERNERAVAIRDTFMSIGLIAIGAVLYALYVRRAGLAVLTNYSDLAEKYLVSSGLGPLIAGLKFLTVGFLWAEAGNVSRRLKVAARVGSFVLITWCIIGIATRTYAVVLILGHLFIWLSKRKPSATPIRARLALGAAVLWAGMEAFGLLRGFYVQDQTSLVAALREESGTIAQRVVGTSEFSQAFLTAVELRHREEWGSLLGSSYARGLLTLFPVVILPDRPQTLSEEFVNDYYPKLAARGGGTAFSLVGEAWLNFGPFVGPALAGLAVGLGLGWTQLRLRRYPDGFVSRLSPYVVFIVLTIHRNPGAVILKEILIVAAPALALYLALGMLQRGRGTTRRGDPLAGSRLPTDSASLGAQR